MAEFEPTPENPLYSISTVASMFDVGPAQVREWCKEGKVKATKVFGQWKIPASEVKRIANEEYGA